MPDDDTTETPAANDKAAIITQQLEAEIADARADVRADAANDEQKKIDQERLENLEQRLAAVEKRGSDVPTSAPIVEAPTPPAAPAADDGAVAALSEKVEALAETIAEPVEAVADTTAEAAEDAEEVIEELPKRTHGLFRPVFGKRD